ncbi:MAG: ABC transporter ATP-binding protein [Candidatus Pelagibacter sp. TMED273]|nr:MAG: ABC transporter ATP-binding protein [Candidatus Pelagibacter sp. TMED273]
MIMIMAIIDMIGVASILPFIAVLSNPNIIETNNIISSMYKFSHNFGVENSQQFLFILGILVFVLLVFSLFFKALTTYAQVRFVQMREYSISRRLVEGYLNQPYSWFLNRHSADLGKTILSEVSVVIGNGIFPLMELISKGIVVIALITLLILVDPKIAVIVGLSLSAVYLLIFYLVRKFLNRIGKERLNSNKMRFTTVSEAFGASKEVKIGGLEELYINRFSTFAKNFAQSQASSQVISQLPRFILEAVAFGGIMLIILFMMLRTGEFNNSLPIISLYVFAGYRLMPALQSIYASFTSLTFVGPSIDTLDKDLKNLDKVYLEKKNEVIKFNKLISLKSICYTYPNTTKTVLKNISINIASKSKVAFIGTTGSGKTTIIDIILGLLDPQKGSLEVDNKKITKQNLRSWQQIIGYVPQHIYLSDDTIAANIAFGLNTNDIDKHRVEKVSKIANLHEFVTNELPNNYQTFVGERGVRLSGGQRQRIGIARALYNNPKLLILDEATSALDNETEKSVMDALNNLHKDITIILIAHRLNTVKNCDIVFKLDKGDSLKEISTDDIMSDIINTSQLS